MRGRAERARDVDRLVAHLDHPSVGRAPAVLLQVGLERLVRPVVGAPQPRLVLGMDERVPEVRELVKRSGRYPWSSIRGLT